MGHDLPLAAGNWSTITTTASMQYLQWVTICLGGGYMGLPLPYSDRFDAETRRGTAAASHRPPGRQRLGLFEHRPDRRLLRSGG